MNNELSNLKFIYTVLTSKSVQNRYMMTNIVDKDTYEITANLGTAIDYVTKTYNKIAFGNGEEQNNEQTD